MEESLVQQTLAKSNFYDILGVSTDCNQDQIKKAYRKLSLKLHPDKNSDPQANEAFKKLSKAYKTLSNEDGRFHYDKFGKDEDEMGQDYQEYWMHFTVNFSLELIYLLVFQQLDFKDIEKHFKEKPQQDKKKENNSKIKILLLLPFILLFIFSLVSASSTKSFSVERNLQFSERQNLQDLKFYVPANFDQFIDKKLEAQVLEEIIKQNKHLCQEGKKSIQKLQRIKTHNGQVKIIIQNVNLQSKNINQVDVSACQELKKANQYLKEIK